MPPKRVDPFPFFIHRILGAQIDSNINVPKIIARAEIASNTATLLTL
jgi:hypothetical protein